MSQILIFSGTSEGRALAEILSKAFVPAVVCVATEYGEQVMEPLPGITLHRGRMNLQEMKAFMGQKCLEDEIPAVVDATHPFAEEVSENIRQSAQACGIPYLRFKRSTGFQNTKSDNMKNAVSYFSGHEACADALLHTDGAVLLTTGSSTLAAYCVAEELQNRIYIRTLPDESSIALCRKAGLRGKQIIAMQGPFSEELNLALLYQYDIRHMVTKESGRAGGFEEKIQAAEKAGIPVYVIRSPQKEAGLSFREVLAELEELTGAVFQKTKAMNSFMNISLIGIGMGNFQTLTIEAKEKLRKADYLFGAARMLESARRWGAGKLSAAACPVHEAEAVAEKLKAVYDQKVCDQTASERDMPAEITESATESVIEAAVLFSGDSGFYSGCAKLYEMLNAWQKKHPDTVHIRIYPGISSIAYLAAACGISWQDAKIISIHGRTEWEAEVLSAVRYHKKVFLLVSGAEDVRNIGKLLDEDKLFNENKLSNCRIFAGFQLSYPEETLAEYTPAQCSRIQKEGLYALFIFNEHFEKKYLAPHRSDQEFIRGRIPMTKEEIRELVVCKLKLTEDSVVYDIGSGTGSVAAEIASRSETIRVFAIDQKDEAAELIRQNCEKLRLYNIKPVKGQAPDILEQLPVPARAFIGGSGGRLKDILKALYRKNPRMRIVAAAVSLESVRDITQVINDMPAAHEEHVEVVQVQVSRAVKAGSHHMMQAGNPVFICTFDFQEQ